MSSSLVLVHNVAFYVAVGAAVITLLVAFLLYTPVVSQYTAASVSTLSPHTEMGVNISMVGGFAIVILLVSKIMLGQPLGKLEVLPNF